MVDSRDVEYSGYGEVFQIRDTVWDLVLERCPYGEIEEVKRLLGTSLVEQLNDLQDEVRINSLDCTLMAIRLWSLFCTHLI